MASIQINTPFNLALDFELAPLHKRIFAYLIDLLILVAFSWGMRRILYGIFEYRSVNWYGVDLLLVTTPMWLYALFFEVTMHGQSPGKKVLGIKVMSLEGGDPALSQYLIRWAFRFFEWPLVFSFIYPGMFILYQVFIVGFLGIFVIIIIAVSRANQRLGDLAAGTAVVEARTRIHISETVFLDVNHREYTVRFPDVMRLSDRDINSIKSILDTAIRRQDHKLADMAAQKVRNYLGIESNLDAFEFLGAVLMDYNYLSTK